MGAASTHNMAVKAVRPGGAIMHLGLQDNEGGLDVRAITLKEVPFLGAYTYTVSDLRATAALLDSGALGDLSWVETRRLQEGAASLRRSGGRPYCCRQGGVASVMIGL
ncbi:hypothetical protein GCM10007160_00880 [Litchfieldella qijiaojingensis]|uniref:Zinc-binding dehydrogenase n=1 Tax=Litchfieldella qijiaojingensis TaxID=980347 RepID=A0ABQ2YAM4_9GAMM|nr:hypothetical protein [Halomonas qijiaojingensis]GGX77485.1 hypothetical protein GCM10007160_00880 [Halomonas qijiaojingensis]